jgi:hypothetical protein
MKCLHYVGLDRGFERVDLCVVSRRRRASSPAAPRAWRPAKLLGRCRTQLVR